jgi:hypothetical protein
LFNFNHLLNIPFQSIQVEMCESAHEFLLESWVLIHLPFKPVLLHQWLVGALAETLRFEKEVSEFFHSAIPSNLQKSVKRLASLLKKLHEFINKAFDYLDDCGVKPCIDRRPIIGVVEELLPPLQFVCSVKGKDMVKALKRKLMASASSNEKFVEVEKDSGHHRKFIYNLEFWLGKQKHGRLFGEQKSQKDSEVKPAWLLHNPDDVSENEFLEFMIELVPPETPITKQLKNVLLMSFTLDQKLRLVLLKYKFYSKGLCPNLCLYLISF